MVSHARFKNYQLPEGLCQCINPPQLTLNRPDPEDYYLNRITGFAAGRKFFFDPHHRYSGFAPVSRAITKFKHLQSSD